MPRIDNITGIPRKEKPIFILFEKTNDSSVMFRIYKVIETIKESLCDIQKKSPDAEIKVGVYSFSSSISDDVYPERLEHLEDFDIEEIIYNSNVNLTNVFNRLEHDLSRTVLLTAEYGYLHPDIILVLAGNKKYYGSDELKKLTNNSWFSSSRRIVVLMDNHKNDEDDNIINNFASTDETIININKIDNFPEIISILLLNNMAAVSGSILCSRHHSDSNDSLVLVDPINEDSDCDDVGGWE